MFAVGWFILLGSKTLTCGQHHDVLTNSSISAGLFRAGADTNAPLCRLQYQCMLECGVWGSFWQKHNSLSNISVKSDCWVTANAKACVRLGVRLDTSNEEIGLLLFALGPAQNLNVLRWLGTCSPDLWASATWRSGKQGSWVLWSKMGA